MCVPAVRPGIARAVAASGDGCARLYFYVPLAAWLAANRAGRLRPSAPWLRIGQRPDGTVLILAVGTVVAAGAALALWTVVVTPAAPPYLAQLQQYPVGLAILGVIGFALVNPIWEEAMFRGAILEDLTAIWGAGPAVIVQAVLFGAAHWAGFPSGWVGMLMAAGWGLRTRNPPTPVARAFSSPTSSTSRRTRSSAASPSFSSRFRSARLAFFGTREAAIMLKHAGVAI